MFRQVITAAALAIVGVACATPGGSKEGQAAARPRPDSIHVDVLNENYYAARIHAAYDGGQRRSLGTIDGNGARSKVTIVWEPRQLVFEIAFVTDGSLYTTHPVDVVPGESIELRLPQNISASGFFRRLRRN
jgi:hypothetical protein